MAVLQRATSIGLYSKLYSKYGSKKDVNFFRAIPLLFFIFFSFQLKNRFETARTPVNERLYFIILFSIKNAVNY